MHVKRHEAVMRNEMRTSCIGGTYDRCTIIDLIESNTHYKMGLVNNLVA